jgi:hypothetical protein
MPRYRNAVEPVGTLVGRLLLLIAAGPKTSSLLASRLRVTRRQINRYVQHLIAAGWRIERHGVRQAGEFSIVLARPHIDPGLATMLMRTRSRR